MREKMREKKGITLIALVITIVVLLILAGVSLNALVGETGIMENAKKASREWNENAAEESAELDSITWNKYLQLTDVPKPTASIESGTIGNNSWYKGEAVKIKLTQADGFADKIEKMTYKINGTQGTTGEITIEDEGIITITQDGINTITAWAYDTEGNPSVPEIIQIKKDSVAPTFGVSVSEGYYDVTVTVSNINDVGSGMLETPDISYYYRLRNNGEYNPSSTAMISGLWENTAYDIKVVVKDKAGNEGVVERQAYTMGTICFVAGTQVLTENGMKNIEDIQVGEQVYTINIDTNARELKPVLQTFISDSTDIFELTIGNEVVQTTPRHQFYIVDKGWIRAHELEVGDMLVAKDNEDLVIEDINLKEYKDNPVKVYNFEVEGNHNYLVTKYELLVHNSSSKTTGDL